MRMAGSACRVASHMAATSCSAWRAQQSSIWGGLPKVGQQSPPRVKPSATQACLGLGFGLRLGLGLGGPSPNPNPCAAHTAYSEQALGGGPLAGSATWLGLGLGLGSGSGSGA